MLQQTRHIGTLILIDINDINIMRCCSDSVNDTRPNAERPITVIRKTKLKKGTIQKLHNKQSYLIFIENCSWYEIHTNSILITSRSFQTISGKSKVSAQRLATGKSVILPGCFLSAPNFVNLYNPFLGYAWKVFGFCFLPICVVLGRKAYRSHWVRGDLICCFYYLEF